MPRLLALRPLRLTEPLSPAVPDALVSRSTERFCDVRFAEALRVERFLELPVFDAPLVAVLPLAPPVPLRPAPAVVVPRRADFLPTRFAAFLVVFRLTLRFVFVLPVAAVFFATFLPAFFPTLLPTFLAAFFVVFRADFLAPLDAPLLVRAPVVVPTFAVLRVVLLRVPAPFVPAFRDDDFFAPVVRDAFRVVFRVGDFRDVFDPVAIPFLSRRAPCAPCVGRTGRRTMRRTPAHTHGSIPSRTHRPCSQLH